MKDSEKIGEQVFHSAVQSIDSAVILHNRRLEVVFVNDAFEGIFGIRKEDALGRSPMNFLPEFDKKHKEAIQARLKNTLISGTKSPYHEFNYYSPTRKFRCLLAVSVPVFNRKREITHVMSLIHDITRRKDLEKEVLKAARISSVADTAFTVAHEINNPLTGIKLGLKTLYHSLKKEENIQVLDSVMKDLNRIEKIVSSFLKANKSPSQPEKHKLSVIEEILDDVLFHLSGQLDLRNISVEKRFCPQERYIFADRDRIYQVFLNILLNAIQIMKEKGEITVSTSLVESQASPEVQGRCVCISLTDSGPGISTDDPDEIFRPFYSTKPAGTGLGLSICKDIISAHKGLIKAQNQRGRGTTIQVYLPIIDS
ncbi:MAG: ATP-binding protein [Deltaproteobacteria bacterium]